MVKFSPAVWLASTSPVNPYSRILEGLGAEVTPMCKLSSDAFGKP